MSGMQPSVPGWYADPWGHADSRWWDGSVWTDQVATNGVAGAVRPTYQPAPVIIHHQPVKTGANGCVVALAVVGGIVVLLVVAVIVVTVIGASSSDKAAPAHRASATPSSGSPGGSSQPAAACKDTPDSVALNTKAQGLYPTRPGIQGDDHESTLGDCVRVDGVSAFAVAVRTMSEQYTGDKALVVTALERNRDAGPKSYNEFDWKLQTPSGQLLSPTIFIGDIGPSLGSGELVTGGEVAGSMAFAYQGPGTYYVIWEPSFFNTDRGVWGVTVN
jgi:hypothetical protein